MKRDVKKTHNLTEYDNTDLAIASGLSLGCLLVVAVPLLMVVAAVVVALW